MSGPNDATSLDQPVADYEADLNQSVYGLRLGLPDARVMSELDPGVQSIVVQILAGFCPAGLPWGIQSVGQHPGKGSLAIGSDADITLVDLHLSRTVNPAELGSYSDYNLYEGQTLTGWPVQTIVRGQTVMANGCITGQAGNGHYIFRSLDTPTPGA